MDKHTFKVGDRVFGQVRTGDKKVPGVFVKMGGHYNEGCIIRRDDGVSGIEPGLYWYGKHLTTHDTDFQVGDWVRYERVVPEHRHGEIDKQYIDNPLTVERIRGDGSIEILAHDKPYRTYRVCERENLIKIQPPQEEKKMDKKEGQIDIVHRETGEVVRGVTHVIHPLYTWKKTQDDRETTFSIEHWRRYEEWVKIEVLKRDWDQAITRESKYMLIGGYGVLYREVK